MVRVDPLGGLGRDAGRPLAGDEHRMSTSWVARSMVTPTSRMRAGNGPGATARDGEDRRQPAGLEQPTELEDRRVEPLDMADLDRRRAARGRRGDESVGFGRRRRQRLLDEDGDPALERGQRQREVAGRRRRDDDGVELRFGEHRQRLAVALGTAPSLAAAERLGVRIGDRHKPDAARAASTPKVVAAHRAEADQADARPRARRWATRRRSPRGHRASGGGARRLGAGDDRGPHRGDDGRLLVVGEARVHRQRQAFARTRRSVTGRSASIPSSSTYGWRWTGIG